MLINTSTYPIYIGDEIFFRLDNFLSDEKIKYSKKIILADENTYDYCLPFALEKIVSLKEVIVIKIKSGEQHKNIETCIRIWNELTEQNADRKSLIINLGGGMISDIGGFAASTYQRGIDFINIPTTLLAMVDASVGGKTGIDFNDLKNQIGLFSKPQAVFIFPRFLKTLPERELRSGFAEVIKHALISGEKYWNEIKNIGALNSDNLSEIIFESVSIKNEIVNSDFRERNRRKILNFGHTIGHAIESYSLKHHPHPLKHGEAIAIGMIGELYLSYRQKSFPENIFHEIVSLIKKHFSVTVEFNIDEVIQLMRSDKKNYMNQINFVLLENIGTPFTNQHLEDSLVHDALQFSLQQFNSFAVS